MKKITKVGVIYSPKSDTDVALINDCINLYKKTLNKDSKFYAEDMAYFATEVSKKSGAELLEHKNKLVFLQSKGFEKETEKQVQRMADAGMFDLNRHKK